jgi:serine/threonine protein phosphatase PrpC
VTDAAVLAVPLVAAFRTDPGRIRQNNEDLPLLDAERGIFGVIDGVGGQNAGEVAAAIARDVILQRLARPLGTPAERVREAIALANNEIYRRARTAPDLAGMTCVVTLAIVSGGRLTIGHVGDSRLYTIGPRGLRKLTHDHSPVGEREDAREISEMDAMRHPRRHEVFRDVGSAHRDKDEDDYVEVVETTMEPDTAILLCSDGLTDMIPSATVGRIVRTHAGNAQAIADALIEAANEAGGRDNVTVVYAEGADFATAIRRAPAFADALLDEPQPAAQAPSRGGSAIGRLARRVVASRTVWFTLGAILGVAAALLFVWRTTGAVVPSGRTIVAGPAASATAVTLAAAVSAAAPGDVIRLEPGTYAERLAVPDGVSVVARVPGASIFVNPSDAAEWVAITAGGDTGGTIAGLRVESSSARPVAVGLRLAGHGRSLELLQMDGPMRAGIAIDAEASASLHGSHFTVAGAALTLADRGQCEATGNAFVRTLRAAGPAVSLGDAAQAVLRRNVFTGYGRDLVAGLPDAERDQVRAANIVVSTDAPGGR